MGQIHDFSIDQGATHRLRVSYMYQSSTGTGPVFVPVHVLYNLTGCSARMQIRESVGSPVLISLSSDPGGGIEIEPDGARGQIDVTIMDTQTQTLELRRAVYDLELIWPSGDVARIMQGEIAISLNVTEAIP